MKITQLELNLTHSLWWNAPSQVELFSILFLKRVNMSGNAQKFRLKTLKIEEKFENRFTLYIWIIYRTLFNKSRSLGDFICVFILFVIDKNYSPFLNKIFILTIGERNAVLIFHRQNSSWGIINSSFRTKNQDNAQIKSYYTIYQVRDRIIKSLSEKW